MDDRICPAPLPPRRPKNMPPKGACDSHIHVIGPFDRFPLAADRSYTPPASTVGDYRTVMQTLGLERVVIVHPSCHGLDLGVTIDAVAQFGERARGIAVVKADIADSELDRLNDCGFRGVRVVTTVRGGVDPDEAPKLARRVARLGWHVQCLINGPLELEALAPKLRNLETPYVIDGMGRFGPVEPLEHPGFRTLLSLLETGNCWVKLSGESRRTKVGPPYQDMTPYAQALIAVRDDRLIWGTDWPHVQGWDYQVPNDCDLLEWLYSMDASDRTLERILVDNPAQLYGFPPIGGN